MKTIRIEFGIDTATTENIDMDKYLIVVSKSIRALLPDYKFVCSVNQDDNAETRITNENELEYEIVQSVNEAIVESESTAINDPNVCDEIVLPVLKCTRCKHKWIPRTSNNPRFCPNCNSPYWDKPKIK
jgi:hypothetical protein